MKIWAQVFTIIMVGISMPAQTFAGSLTIGDMQKACIAHKRVMTTGRAVGADKIEAGQCQGFIIGVIDGFLTGLMEAGAPKSPFCNPSGWNIEQGSLVFLKWAEQHPEHLDKSAAEGVIASHIAAFPCKGH